MDHRSVPNGANGTGERSAGMSPGAAAALRSLHVHATPAAVAAEQDARSRSIAEWLARLEGQAGCAAAGPGLGAPAGPFR